MSKNSASGHNGNLTDLNELIKACTTLGSLYNPAAQNLSVQSMTLLYQRANTLQEALVTAESELKTLIATRFNAFEAFGTYIISVRNIFESTCDDQKQIDQFDTIYRKLKGRRATEIEKSDKAMADPNLLPKKHISSSQTGFDDTLLNFKKAISNLQLFDSHKPNEEEYAIPCLTNHYQALADINDKTKEAYNKYVEALNNRNFAFYAPGIGVVDIGRKAKKYVKGILKPGNALYKEFTKFIFRTYNTDELIELPGNSNNEP